MKIHRFFFNTEFLEGKIYINDTEFIHQIRDVLKLHSGETCILFNIMKQEAEAIIVAYDKKGVLFDIKKVIQGKEQKTKITLYCAILKRENFELVVQKTTELGVSKIVPVVTQRTIKTGLRKDRLEKIAIEASEQSGQIRIPIINEPMLFTDALYKAHGHELIVLFHTHIKNKEKIKTHTYRDIGLFVGPEGGFNEDEIKQAQAYNNCHIYTFPNTILRAETAAIVSVFWAQEYMMKNN